MDIEIVEKLIKAFDASNSTELSIKTDELQLKLSKNQGRSSGPAQIIEQHAAPAVSLSNTAHPAPAAAAPAVDESLHVVTSPLVGTFYRSSSPDSAPFVKIGDRVNKGDTICIIEAMKLMNEIESDATGEVVEIHVENANLVEFGSKLITVKPD